MNEQYQIITGDCLEILPSYDDGYFDCCIADPPFNISKKKGLGWAFSSHITMQAQWDIFTKDDYFQFSLNWLREVCRVVKVNGNIFVFGSFHSIFAIGFILQHLLNRKIISQLVWYKCIAGDTPIFAIIDRKPSLLPLRDLGQYRKVKLFSFDEYGHACLVAIKRFEPSPQKDGLSITLKSGLQISLSDNHRVPILKNGILTEVLAKDLKLGDSMLVLSKFPIPKREANSVFLSDIIGHVEDIYVNNCSFGEYLKGKVLLRDLVERYNIPIQTLQWHITTQQKMPLMIAIDYEIDLTGKTLSEKKSKCKRIPNEIKLNFEVGYLVGAYLAEGSCSGCTVQFSCHAKEDDFRKNIIRGLSYFNLKAQTHIYGNTASLNVSSRILQKFLNHFLHCGTAREKYLLQPCFSSPEDFRHGLLQGYIDGDGHFDRHNRITCNHTHNERLQDSLIALCRTLGITVLYDRRMRGIKNQHGNYLVDDFRIRIDSIDVSLYKGDLITQKVTKIEPVANIDFYDLEVGGNSMFAVGNGIVTHNSNAQPNITCRMFTESTEFIIWAVNSEPHKAKNWTFNYDVMKQMNDGKQMRNVFQIPVTPKSERKYGKHPAQKPEAILERLILAGTNEGDIIIDPFSGTGTTGVVAKRFNRNCVMIDNNEYYNDIAKKRLLDE